MNKHWRFYDSATGLFAPSMVSLPPLVAPSPPAGHVAIEGTFDPATHRFDLVAEEVVDWQPPAPADTDEVTYAWSAERGRWVGAPTVAGLKRRARDAIDAAAGAARLRYITDVPGQQGTYVRKAEQAAAFAAAGYSGTVPPYIQAEAAALGVSAQAAADGVLAIAVQWDGVIGPAIEQARIGGKAAVAAVDDTTGDPADVDAARDAALAALAAI